MTNSSVRSSTMIWCVAIPMGSRTSIGLSLIRLGVDDIPDTRNAGVDINGT